MEKTGTQSYEIYSPFYSLFRVFRREPYSIRSGNFVYIRVIELS